MRGVNIGARASRMFVTEVGASLTKQAAANGVNRDNSREVYNNQKQAPTAERCLLSQGSLQTPSSMGKKISPSNARFLQGRSLLESTYQDGVLKKVNVDPELTLSACKHQAMSEGDKKISQPNARLLASLKEDVEFDINMAQEEAFNKGLSWGVCSVVLRNKLQKKYEPILHESVLSISSNKSEDVDGYIDRSLKRRPSYQVGKEGGRLDKKVLNLLHRDSKHHTIIQAESGRRYQLLNKLDEGEATEVNDTLGCCVEKGKVVVGQGAAGTVRFARASSDDQVVVVKKMTCNKDDFNFKREIEQEIAVLKRVQSSHYQIKLLDIAKIHKEGGDLKYYLFMEFGGSLNGADLLEQIDDENEMMFESTINYLTHHYVKALAELHDLGIYHLDVKPLNFFHHEEDGLLTSVKLGDYGLSVFDEFQRVSGGTPGFNPPEMLDCAGNEKNPYLVDQYSNIKRDAWALGVTLLLLKCKGEVDMTDLPTLIVNQRDPSSGVVQTKVVDVGFDEQFNCQGVSNAGHIEVRTLDDLIAKFLAVEPQERLSPQDALKTTLFRDE